MTTRNFYFLEAFVHRKEHVPSSTSICTSYQCVWMSPTSSYST